MNLHAHFSTESQDCDGRYSSEHVLTMNDSELAAEFGDIDFHNRVVSNVVNSYSLDHSGRLEVSKAHDGSVCLDWTEPTDEGYRNTSAQFCTDETCDVDTRSQRDHSAERAGY